MSGHRKNPQDAAVILESGANRFNRAEGDMQRGKNDWDALIRASREPRMEGNAAATTWTLREPCHRTSSGKSWCLGPCRQSLLLDWSISSLSEHLWWARCTCSSHEEVHRSLVWIFHVTRAGMKNNFITLTSYSFQTSCHRWVLASLLPRPLASQHHSRTLRGLRMKSLVDIDLTAEYLPHQRTWTKWRCPEVLCRRRSPRHQACTWIRANLSSTTRSDFVWWNCCKDLYSKQRLKCSQNVVLINQSNRVPVRFSQRCSPSLGVTATGGAVVGFSLSRHSLSSKSAVRRWALNSSGSLSACLFTRPSPSSPVPVSSSSRAHCSSIFDIKKSTFSSAVLPLIVGGPSVGIGSARAQATAKHATTISTSMMSMTLVRGSYQCLYLRRLPVL